jgi:hypothetical protein
MIIDNLPRRPMTREEARRRTDEFKVHTEAWLEELAALHDDQVWRALGYYNWGEYCAAEFGSIRLPRGEGRTEAVVTLRQASMSIRDISSALGLGRGTVERELNAADADSLPDTIIGADGKYQPASKPDKSEPAEEPETPAEVDEIEAAVPNGTAAPETEPATPPEEVEESEGSAPEPEPVEAKPVPETPLRPIDDLLAELKSVVADLERHCKAMTFPFPTGPDMYGQMGNEIDPRQVRHHPFTDGAHEVINDVRERLREDEGVARDLSDAEDLRAIWPTMTPTQKRHYIREMEEMENDHPEYNKLWQLRHDKRERHESPGEDRGQGRQQGLDLGLRRGTPQTPGRACDG